MNLSDYSVEEYEKLWDIVDSYFEFPVNEEHEKFTKEDLIYEKSKML